MFSTSACRQGMNVPVESHVRMFSSEYMQWVKLQAQAPHSLVPSGMMYCPLAFLGAELADLEINGPSTYGYAPLREAVARHAGVDPRNVLLAQGTSMANHLAFATFLQPGDHVLIEDPTYELLCETASYIGASIRRFQRLRESGYALDLEIIERALTPQTRLIVVTNLHNPSGAYTPESTLIALGELAARHNARVLVDEVYLEAHQDLSPRSAFHLGEVFITTNSLTKVYGLNGLRCGWTLANPDLVERMWRLNDLFGVIPPHPAELLSTRAFARMPALRQRTRNHLDAHWAFLKSELGALPQLEWFMPPAGTIVFPRLLEGSVETLCSRLRSELGTAVVPGRFFSMPDHFRIGVGGSDPSFQEGVRRLKQGLQQGLHLSH